jgi:hypothetical protein
VQYLAGSDWSLSALFNYSTVEIHKSGREANTTTKIHKKLSITNITIHLAP